MRRLPIGTRSVLYGAHAFCLHPWFVAWAWHCLYGFPWDPRLWVVFFVHDLGYWGKPNMDGPEGETHVEWGANLCHTLFDHTPCLSCAGQPRLVYQRGHGDVCRRCLGSGREPEWKRLCLYHSRFYAWRRGHHPSKLCFADKLATALEPWWLYLPRVRATGEIVEYKALSETRDVPGESPIYADDDRLWFINLKIYLLRWVWEYKDGKGDTWTPKR